MTNIDNFIDEVYAFGKQSTLPFKKIKEDDCINLKQTIYSDLFGLMRVLFAKRAMFQRTMCFHMSTLEKGIVMKNLKFSKVTRN